MSAEATLDLVLFRTGGWLVAVQARQVLASEMHNTEDATPLATQVLNLEEKALKPIPDKRFKLYFQEQNMIVDGPLELLRCNAADIHPLPTLIKAHNRLPGLRALLSYQEQYALIFEV